MAGEKKRGLLKKFAWAGVGFVGLVAVGFLVLVVVSNSALAETVEVPCEVAAISIPEGDQQAVERGKYLVDHVMGCKQCHAADLGGRAEVDDGMIGKLWAPNLTSGKGSTVTEFTPADWVRSIRHGVGKNGRRLVLMPSEDYFSFSDEDLAAVVAYVKSVPPVDRADEGINLGPLGRFLITARVVEFAFHKIDHNAKRPEAKPGPTLEWGKVMIGACMGCHGHELSGGPIPGTPPEWAAPRNLTPHETGLKGWTREQFATAMRQGKRPDGTDIDKLMPWQAYAGMTDDDVTALWLHLQTVAPKEFGGR